MVIDIIILFVVILSKFIKQTLIFNFLYIPAALYLFLSPRTIFYNRKLSLFLFFIFFILIFSCSYLFSSLSLGIENICFRVLSLSFFYLSMFGLLPLNHFLFNKFRFLILFSIPAILTIVNPPWFYQYASNSTDFRSSEGLFAGFSVAGLFPTSLYFAQILSAYILYFNSFKGNDKFTSIIPILSKKINRFILLIAMVFTNRKAYLFSLVFYPLYDLIIDYLVILKNKFLKVEVIQKFLILISAFLLIYGLLFFGVSRSRFYDFSYIFNDLFGRVQVYIRWLVNPEAAGLGETGLLYANLFGGYPLFLLTFFLFILSSVLSFIRLIRLNLNLNKILYFFVSYIYLAIFLFKDASTMWSPSPASLLLCIMISFLIRNILYY